MPITSKAGRVRAVRRIRAAIGAITIFFIVFLSPLETAKGEGAPAPIVKKEPQKIETPEITDWELEWLARAVWSEAGTEEYSGMRLVAAVILNRVEHEAFPSSIYEVITQPGQFEAYRNGAMIEKTPTPEAIAAARDEMIERSNTEVLFFRTKKYHSGTTPVIKHKNHYFSK